jgi:hypothetical protein
LQVNCPCYLLVTLSSAWRRTMIRMVSLSACVASIFVWTAVAAANPTPEDSYYLRQISDYLRKSQNGNQSTLIG